jgi:OmpA-OmpF porin, OOP family
MKFFLTKLCSFSVCFVCLFAISVFAQGKFIRGNSIIFEDNLKFEKIGEFPSRWELIKGSAEVAVYEGDNVLSFLITQTEIRPYMKNNHYLPESFTIEFEYLMNHFKQHSYEIDFFGSDGKRSGRLRFNGESYSLNSARGGKVSEGRTPNTSADFAPGWKRFALSFNQQEMRVFCDDMRVLNVPRYNIEIKSLLIRSGRPQSARPNSDAFIKNIVIAEGGMPLYEKVMTEGKFVTSEIQFDVNKADIKPESMAIIHQVYQVMVDHPDLRFSVEGHTDSDGDDELNQHLSSQRAENIVSQLIKMGIETDRLNAKGWGASKPVADNSTAEGKARNRRVEFVRM